VSFVRHVLLSREDIINKLTEQRNILSNKLRHVHISEGTSNNHLFVSSFLLSTFVSTSSSEDGENVTETEIIMSGLRKLHLTKFVQNIELNRERLVVGVSHGGQLNLHDNLSIGQHHSYTSKEYLKVLREFLTSSVTRVHGDEIGNIHLEDNHTVIRELEHLLLEFLTEGDRLNLSGDDGKSGERNSVEFIETTPNTGGTKSLENLSHTSEFEFRRAVKHDDPNSECATKILGGLGLSSSGGSSGGTTIAHTKSLGKSDIASVGKRSNSESLLYSEEFVGVSERDILKISQISM